MPKRKAKAKKRKKPKSHKWKMIVVMIILLVVVYSYVSYPRAIYSKQISSTSVGTTEETFEVPMLKYRMKIIIEYEITGYTNITIIDPDGKTLFTWEKSVIRKDSGSITRSFDISKSGEYTIIYQTLGSYALNIMIYVFNPPFN
ncbi:MAG: hypothetical protein ACTSSP_09015 [Candidatus Asgardarchaeia archaeon]